MLVKGDLLNITTDDFKKFYFFLYNYNLTDKSKKLLDYDYVEFYFNNLFGSQFKIIKTFLEFYSTIKKKEPMKNDPWYCFLGFLIKIGDNFPKGYRTQDSWPTLFDEFFNWYCKKYNIVIKEEEDDD